MTNKAIRKEVDASRTELQKQADLDAVLAEVDVDSGTIVSISEYESKSPYMIILTVAYTKA